MFLGTHIEPVVTHFEPPSLSPWLVLLDSRSFLFLIFQLLFHIHPFPDVLDKAPPVFFLALALPIFFLLLIDLFH